MFRVTFDTESKELCAAVVQQAATHGVTPRVEDLDLRDSETWLAERVYGELIKKGFDRLYTLEGIQQKLQAHRQVTIAAITKLTLENFLEQAPRRLPESIFEVMTSIGATFADGANPAEFLRNRFERTLPLSMAPWLLGAGVISWKMFPYLSIEFVKGINGIGRGARLKSIREQLREHKLTFKNGTI